METTDTKKVPAASDFEVVNTRLVPEPPSLVFQAISTPEILARWWGPDGFSNVFHEFDFKPGGNWRIDMQGPDGTIYPNHSVFEKTDPDCVTIRHLGPVHEFTLAILLAPEANGTRIIWRMTFVTEEAFKEALAYVPSCNEQNLDRLEAELAQLTAGERELVLRRIIDAPPAAVFRAWTEPALITRWFTPPPYETTHADLDVRPGGSNLIVMRGPDGIDMPNRGIYLEVVENERLVTTDAYTRAWEPSEKPFMTLALTFENLDGRTRYTARASHWTLEDKEAHLAMGFHQGWGIATGQLAALAANI